ncbi:sugar ABC transporter permease [Candidatus Aerophobetes bacterium]|uniref:Sugar ABC transporter permease n=1 Tax=Aerophobetes bacterium TaxID=2030807 RepID=A0A523UUR8_UNCAE|nr:MAG: sugar ABC transporter permease [Candidatus Aerophobetes bacterium]
MERSRKQMSSRKGGLYILWEYKLPYLFLLPSVILLIFFLAAPLVSGIYMSFQKISLRGISEFVGFRNYRLLLGEGRFRNNLLFSVLYVAGNVGLSVPLAYAAALLITGKLRGIQFFRAIFLIPFIVTPVVSAILFRSMVNPSFGPITALLEMITGKHYIILADSTLAMLTIIGHSFWRSFSFIMLFLAAGIATIPTELYEAGKVDGAGAWARFSHITFPLTKIHLTIVLLIITMWTLQDAETVYALTQGGPGYSTEVTAVRLFKDAFINFNLSYGATIGVFLLMMSAVFMIFYFKLMGGAEHY